MFSAHSASDDDGGSIIFQLQDDLVGPGSSSFQYSDLFGFGDSESRGMPLLSQTATVLDETNNAYGRPELSETEVVGKPIDGIKPITPSTSTFPTFRQKMATPGIVPAILLNQNFEVSLSVDNAVKKIDSFLKFLPGLKVSFIGSEYLWNCEQIIGVATVNFDIRIFRYPRSHVKSGMLVVEMHRNCGDRMHYFSIFESLRDSFAIADGVSGAGFDIETLPSSSAVQAGPDAVCEDEIKMTLLSIISSDRVDFKTMLEAVQLAGTVFTGFQLKSVDLHLLDALENLSVSNPQFYWIQPFVVQKRKALVHELHFSPQNQVAYGGLVFVR
jgi:hypothetical protein